MDRAEIGRRGEREAEHYLKERGFCILTRNFHSRRGEIDLIARDGRELVFVEVRYRRSAGYGSPMETVDYRKRRRLVKAAEYYLLRRGASDIPCRFDVIALSPRGDGVLAVEHCRNAFDRDGNPFG